MTLKIALEHPSRSDAELAESIVGILNANELCAVATVSGTESYIHTAYFAYSQHLDLYFLSQPSDRHVTNILDNPTAAVAVWNPTQAWGRDLQGLQMFGRAEKLGAGLELVTAMGLLMGRFHGFSEIMKSPGEFVEGVTSRVFVVRSTRVKILDEPRFGRRNYIEVDIARD